MEKLDIYLNIKKEPKPDICCKNVNIGLSQNLLLYVCFNCATVVNQPYNVDYYEPNKNPLIVKTYIPYYNKFRHLYRINKWTNYVHAEVSLNKLLQNIDKLLIDYDKEIISFTKILFKQLYDGFRIRAKIKDALIGYCLYKSHLMLNKEVDIDDIILLLDITIKNYNDLIKKLTFDKLYYFKNINKYLKIVNDKMDYKIDKNILIKIFNNFYQYNIKYNNKTITLGIIFYILKSKNINIEKFYYHFNISRNSITSIQIFMNENVLE